MIIIHVQVLRLKRERFREISDLSYTGRIPTPSLYTSHRVKD